MTIEVLDFAADGALGKEMEFFAGNKDQARNEFTELKSRDDVRRYVEQRFEYADIVALARSTPACRVLDVGVAYGVTSAYLALHGHDVTAVEPSMDMCHEMAALFSRLSIPVSVVCGTGETIDQIKSTFDLVVFYSSLHHCDDPRKALRNAREKLIDGGRVFLWEPVLKFYRTKAWFYRTLETNPEQLGHYGGNEHIYRAGEYAAFARRAGFRRVDFEPSITYRQVPKKAPWDGARRYALKKLYFSAVRGLVLKGPFGFILRPILFRLSLLNPVIKAVR